MRLDQRFMNIGEDLSSGVARVELGHDSDRLGPAWRFGWDVHRLFLVLLNPQDRPAQPEVHLGIARKVLAYGVAHARELAFDDALLALTARREQNRPISRHKTLLCLSDGMRSQPQPSRQGCAG